MPVTKGSYIQLIATVEGAGLTAAGVNERMRELCTGSFGYAEEELVSGDIAGTNYESIFDPFQTKVLPVGEGLFLVEVATWFDNETSYVSHFMKIAEML